MKNRIRIKQTTYEISRIFNDEKSVEELISEIITCQNIEANQSLYLKNTHENSIISNVGSFQSPKDG